MHVHPCCPGLAHEFPTFDLGAWQPDLAKHGMSERHVLPFGHRRRNFSSCHDQRGFGACERTASTNLVFGLDLRDSSRGCLFDGDGKRAVGKVCCRCRGVSRHFSVLPIEPIQCIVKRGSRARFGRAGDFSSHCSSVWLSESRRGPAFAGYLLCFGGAPAWSPWGRWFRRLGGLNPGEHIAFVPAQSAAAWHLERAGDQVAVLGAGGEGADRSDALAQHPGQVLGEEHPHGGGWGVKGRSDDRNASLRFWQQGKLHGSKTRREPTGGSWSD